ncbi:MAG TPA: IS1-like element transposase [Saprospiraceae bacterium]|nr:IS1-like element transposase [Saprospiraceae bacterium]
MVLIPVCCPHCGSDQVVKRGKTRNAKQRYLCQQPACPAQTFMLDDDYQGYVPEVKKRIIDMALNGSGIRDTARVLEISPNTVISELKKRILPRIGQPSGAGTLESNRCYW